MRISRKLRLASLTALALGAIVAPGAAAQVAIDPTTAIPLAVGSMTNAVSSTSVVFTTAGGATVTCASSELDGTVTVNPPFTEQVDVLTFSNCMNNGGAACTVTAQGLPWSAPGGGLLASSVPGFVMTLGMDAGDYLDISCGGGAPCSLQGGRVGPGPLTNSITGAWTNPAPPAKNDLFFNNEPLVGVATATGNNCGNAAFRTMYVIRTGTVPGGGTQIGLV